MPERGIDFRQHILPRIHQLIIDSIVANKDELRQGVTRRCFELYGYDFMVGAALRLLVLPTLIAAYVGCRGQIDEDLRAWLIEVNTNPYLGVQNPWHGQLLENMVEDMVRLVVDPTFPPPAAGARKSTAASRSNKDTSLARRHRPIPKGDGPCYVGEDSNRTNDFQLVYSESPTFVPPVRLRAPAVSPAMYCAHDTVPLDVTAEDWVGGAHQILAA